MKITGFITEYNPFHNGHLYHAEKAKEITGADYTVALMSGSHVQRGEPAVFDKYVRTKMALQAGVDLVLEMPAAFSTASAMEFASYGVALFSSLGAVNSLVFGSECGELRPLLAAARLLSEETPEFQQAIQAKLKSGMTYPQARTEALLESISNEYEGRMHSDSMQVSDSARFPDSIRKDELKQLLLFPNNILGIEYLRAGLALHSPLEFHTIRRKGSGYHDAVLPENNFPSASAIRSALARFQDAAGSSNITAASGSNTAPRLCSSIPAACIDTLTGEIPIFPNDYSLLLQDRILNSCLDDIADLNDELASRLKKTAPWPASFEERIQALKSRQFTYTRVSRVLLHLVLGIHNEEIALWKSEGYASYARILGFRKESSSLLKELKKHTSIPFITKVADAPKQLSGSSLAMLEQEIRVSHLYQSVKVQKGGAFRNEYMEGVIII